MKKYTEEEWFELSDLEKAEHDVQLIGEILERIGDNAPDGELQREFNRLRPKDPVILEYVPIDDEI